MASAKQIAWRKKFAKLYGKKKKGSKSTKKRTISGVGSETPTGKREEYFIQGDWRRAWAGVPFWKLRKKKYYLRNGQTYFKDHIGKETKIPKDVVKALKMKKGKP
jgi:hypothetical protein|tara:strand:+ start:245 stop:559 length:315 start_codon:yes stop_codon:yes gene_type:complete